MRTEVPGHRWGVPATVENVHIAGYGDENPLPGYTPNVPVPASVICNPWEPVTIAPQEVSKI
jgi:hypothetical protein